MSQGKIHSKNVDDRTNEIQKSQALILKNNIDVCWSVSESQVTAPGTDPNIYSDQTTNGQQQEWSLVTAWEPEMTSRENKHLGVTPQNL